MGKWATKNPPKECGRYLISCNNTVCIAYRFEDPKGNWYWDTIFMGEMYDTDVQAWQKLPEPYPYKGEWVND